jgi:hypothetical protein
MAEASPPAGHWHPRPAPSGVPSCPAFCAILLAEVVISLLQPASRQNHPIDPVYRLGVHLHYSFILIPSSLCPLSTEDDPPAD